MATITGTPLGDLITKASVSGGVLGGVPGIDADDIAGLQGDDTLDGDAGNDTLNGGVADDWLIGGAGDDVLSGEDGTDTVEGGLGNDSLSGGDGADSLLGGLNRDTLVGGLGDDTMVGGAGSDVYYVDHPGDLLFELAEPGRDLVYAYVSWTLGANFEDLVLLGGTRGTGNAEANLITGHAGDNVLEGLEGKDTLQGMGGADTLLGGAGDDVLDGGTGPDVLRGGEGNDVLVVDDPGDITSEATNEGTDTVLASISWSLSNNIEALQLTGANAIDGTGNALGNLIIGNDADNVLSGLRGADTLRGGGGNDKLLGGADVDSLEGGDGNDTLDGGPGSDFLAGGKGDDTYLLNAFAGDVVTELPGEGTDTVIVAYSYTLWANVENLVLTGELHANGTGNEGNNRIIGNPRPNELQGLEGDDTLEGAGGADTLLGGGGSDLLIGGGGADSLNGGNRADTLVGGLGDDMLRGGGDADVFRFLSPKGGHDTVLDYSVADDSIEVFGQKFGGLAPGALPSARFAANAGGVATPGTTDGMFCYDTLTGDLVWDDNGALAGGRTTIATFKGIPALAASEFTVIG